VTVNNIPEKRTIFERHIVDALDRQDHNSEDDKDWLSSVRVEARLFPSLSAVDLMDLAGQAGYHVEISWARQNSQAGGLDAIFHRQASTTGAQRSLFKFPTDHQGRLYHLLSNHSMRRRLQRHIQAELYKLLQVGFLLT
jgi:hypothetical protein